jgi:hypothetical protein
MWGALLATAAQAAARQWAAAQAWELLRPGNPARLAAAARQSRKTDNFARAGTTPGPRAAAGATN